MLFEKFSVLGLETCGPRVSGDPLRASQSRECNNEFSNYAVVLAADEWVQFPIAFGYTWVSTDQSSFVVEAQGLDSAMDALLQVRSPR